MKDKDGMPGRTRALLFSGFVALMIVSGAATLFIGHDADTAADVLLTAALFALSGLLADVKWRTKRGSSN